MAKIDLKDAYFTVPIHPLDRVFLQFKWWGKTWEFTCMAFGLSSAPWVFTKLLKPVVTWLRARGVKVVAYLDDFFICADSEEAVLKAVGMVRGILEYLGFVINDGKSVESPLQVMEFLGFLLTRVP